MGTDIYYLLVFNSTHHALEAEDRLKEEGYPIQVVPVPPEISAGCGLAIKFSRLKKEISALLLETKLDFAGFYKVAKDGLEKRITKEKL